MTLRTAINVSLGLLVVIGGVILYFSLRGESDDDGLNDAETIQGKWNLVAQAGDGQPEKTDSLQKLGFQFKGDQFTVIHDEGNNQGTFKLDSSKRPRAIDLIFTEGPEKGKTMEAIYAFRGGNLKLCWNGETFQRPTEFQNKKFTVISTFKREQE